MTHTNFTALQPSGTLAAGWASSGETMENSASPAGMPRTAPASAGRACAAASPALTSWAATPSARASAEACRVRRAPWPTR